MFPFLGAIAGAIGKAIGTAATVAKSAAIGIGKGMIGQSAAPIASISGMGDVPVKPDFAQGAGMMGQKLGAALQQKFLAPIMGGGQQQQPMQPQQTQPNQVASASGGQMDSASPLGAGPQNRKSIEDLFQEARKRGLL